MHDAWLEGKEGDPCLAVTLLEASSAAARAARKTVGARVRVRASDAHTVHVQQEGSWRSLHAFAPAPRPPAHPRPHVHTLTPTQDQWRVVTQTGSMFGAGTDADVFVQVRSTLVWHVHM